MSVKISSDSYNNYEEFINDLHSAGYKTTGLHEGEASFVDYGYALGQEVQDMITGSFDCDEDKELQSRIASVFGSRSVLSNNDFAAACRNIGLTVERFSAKTQYMVDEKNINASGGIGSRKVVNGGISMFKISDGNGGEIIIADANGNASLEIEELFMNQILQNISVDVSQLKTNQNGDNVYHGGSNSVSGVSSLSKLQKENENEKKVSQADYNSQVEAYLRTKGATIAEAENHVNSDLNVYNFSYTGAMKDKEPTEDENIFVTGKI